MVQINREKLFEFRNKKPLKTYIAIMAGHDSPESNKNLKQCLEDIYDNYRDQLYEYGFVFTGGTFHRVITGKDAGGIYKVKPDVAKFFLKRSVHLPRYNEGGNTVLSSLIINKKISVLWSFFYPTTAHHRSSENKVLMRLCDIHDVKIMINVKSILRWVTEEAKLDEERNDQPFPISLILRTNDEPDKRMFIEVERQEDLSLKLGMEVEAENDSEKNMTNIQDEEVVRWSIALVGNGDNQNEIVNLVKKFEREFQAFRKIITTNELGKKLIDEIPGLEKNVYRYHSEMDGGLNEIATEIIFKACKTLIVISDDSSMNSYPEDYRVLKDSTLFNDSVRLITNVSQAREWLAHLVRPKRQEGLTKGLYITGDVCQVSGLYTLIMHENISVTCHDVTSKILIKMVKGNIFPSIENVTDIVPSCGESSYWMHNDLYLRSEKEFIEYDAKSKEQSQKLLQPKTEHRDSSKIFVKNGSNEVKNNRKINPLTGESLPIINDIVKFNDLGFIINSEKMTINKLYHFEFDENVYEIRKDQNNELGIKLLD